MPTAPSESKEDSKNESEEIRKEEETTEETKIEKIDVSKKKEINGDI